MSPIERERVVRQFTANDARHILEGVPDQDYRAMGLPSRVRLENAILLVMPVCPPCIRPPSSGSLNTNLRGQDDVTQMLQGINRRAAAVRESVAASAWDRDADQDMTPALAEAVERLQVDICSYFSRNGASIGRFRSGRGSTVTIKERLSHKEGRMRGNLMGKRVNFSARTVISPDPLLSVEEVGVPISIATSMTVPEVVAAHNVAALQRRVAVGFGELGGAQCIITPRRGVVELSCLKGREAPTLSVGDVVERYLVDGDVAVFNRQPSLHAHSMSGHSIRIMPGSTFRMNLAPTSAFNADFDGDEMNLHAVQSIPARNEVRCLMRARCHLIGAKANKPVMGAVQDALIGAYLMSDPTTRLTKSEVGACLYRVHHPPGGAIRIPPPLGGVSVEGRALWTGPQVVSCLLPADMTMRRGSLRIEQGQLVQGRLDKAALGTSHGGIVQTIASDYGSTRAIHFLSDLQRLVCQFITARGFSVGIKDCMLNDSGDAKVTKKIEQAVEHLEAIRRATEQCEGSISSDEIERGVSRVLGRVLLQTGAVVESETLETNRIRLMGAAGSKGNKINVSQIMGAVGQNTVGGRRIDSTRIPYYRAISDTPTIDRGGFVANSYANGLTPLECFHHAMGGREGLVDTAVKVRRRRPRRRRERRGRSTRLSDPPPLVSPTHRRRLLGTSSGGLSKQLRI